MCFAIIILLFLFSSAILNDFYDDFLKKMDASAVYMWLQAEDIISDGDVKIIQGYASLRVQNLILHTTLKKKCTDETFKVACDVIIEADPTNAVMVQLAKDMKRSLESNTGKGACMCVCACMCV